jgi:hypothetical protein
MSFTTEDRDLLILIREEAIYADRIRGSLVFRETQIVRIPCPLEDTTKRQVYVRPQSPVEIQEQETEVISSASRTKTCARRTSPVGSVEVASSEGEDTSPYHNPDIDKRRTVDDNDVLYGSTSSKISLTYADLVNILAGRKKMNARALRPLANLWGINSKFRKEVMLKEIISEYARRYPKEVAEYEKRKQRTRSVRKQKRKPLRR